MTTQIETKFIQDGAVTGPKLAASASQAVLESKLVGMRRTVLAFATTAASSDTVTTVVEAAAAVDTPRTDLVSGEGIFVGTVAASTDVKKVLIRQAGTDQGVVDDNGDEVFGKLSEAAGVFTLSYFNADNSAFTFGGVTNIDFSFVEAQDLHSLSPEALLQNAVSGVIDATNASVVAEIDQNVDDLITLSGVAENATDLGTFTGSTITNNTTIKPALQELETALEAIVGEQDHRDEFTLSAGDITNRYVDLALIPADKDHVQLIPVGGIPQRILVDFDVISDGADVKRLSWDSAEGTISTGMEADLTAGDVLQVFYQV